MSNLSHHSDFPVNRPGGNEGIYMKDLPDGSVVDIETQHRHYRLVKRDDFHARISGHPEYCPEPVDVEIEGSIAKGPSLLPNPGFIGRGMYLVFKHPRYEQIITTSRIREIHKVA